MSPAPTYTVNRAQAKTALLQYTSGSTRSPAGVVVTHRNVIANIAQIMRRGPAWFAGMGTDKSKGTKVFALTGKVKNNGLVEVPMGISLREIVEDIGDSVAPALAQRIEARRGGGAPLAPALRHDLENRFGSDFGAVRTHTDAEAASLSRALDAQAFTSGSDVYFDAGRYAPAAPEGRALLAHELTHVVQIEAAGRAQAVADYTSGELRAQREADAAAAGRWMRYVLTGEIGRASCRERVSSPV